MSKPYGLRDVKITPYLDAAGKVLSSERIDLPVAQTFSFSEVEEFTDLRGDDRVAASHGAGPSVDWSLGNGGISLEALRAMNGGTILTDSGKRTYRKKAGDLKPYFLVEGQSIDDDGGDVHIVVYRCKATGNIEGEFADSTFFVTNAAGTGSPVPEDALQNADLLYDIVENDAQTSIPSTVVPSVVSVTPPAAVEDEIVLIQGNGFDGISAASGVKFGGTNASSYTVHNTNNITAVMPAGTAGSAPVVVTHPTRGASDPFPYTRGA